MKGKIVHIEIPSGDTGRATEFWGKLTGWSFKNYAEGQEGAPEYHMFEGEPGGAIYPSEDKGIRVYFEADNIDAELDKIRDLGGETEEKMPVPSMGWFAHAKDPDGNEFSVWQSDEIGTDARGHGRSDRVVLDQAAQDRSNSSSGAGEPRIACATSSPHARPMTLPWPE